MNGMLNKYGFAGFLDLCVLVSVSWKLLTLVNVVREQFVAGVPKGYRLS